MKNEISVVIESKTFRGEYRPNHNNKTDKDEIKDISGDSDFYFGY